MERIEKKSLCTVFCNCTTKINNRSYMRFAVFFTIFFGKVVLGSTTNYTSSSRRRSGSRIRLVKEFMVEIGRAHV